MQRSEQTEDKVPVWTERCEEYRDSDRDERRSQGKFQGNHLNIDLRLTRFRSDELSFGSLLPKNLQYMNMECRLQPLCDCQSSDVNMEISQCAVNKHLHFE